MTNRRVMILAGLFAIAAALACGGSGGGDTVQVGVYSEELQQTLHSDPRFENSRAASGQGNDAEGNMTEYISVVMPDENCPEPTYEGCEEVILDVVRLMLTTPHVDHFTGIQVTLSSFLPVRRADSSGSSPGQPPLADKSLDEWREIVGD